MLPPTEFNGPITGHNVLAGLHFETGAIMNNYFGDGPNRKRGTSSTIPFSPDPDLVDGPDILNAFRGGINYALQKDRNRKCAPETGHWFFHHPLYEAFQNGKGSQLLFTTAEAGGGKSTVMRTLADKLLESSDTALTAYFFFKDDDDSLRSYDEALSGLIYQLLVQDRRLLKHVQKLYQKHGDGVKHNTQVMWQALSDIAVNAQRDIFCILDAIDECEESDRKQLVADIENFFQDANHVNSSLKFVVSSRPYQDENHQYDDLFTIPRDNMRHLVGENAEVQSDIHKVIRSKAEELAEKRHLDHNIREMLVEKISAQNRHTRSFLAVHMAFELLDSHRRMHKGAGERTISIILADIPNSLGKQFDEMLRRSLDPQHTRKLFCVILAARRTIKIEELKVIYSLTETSDLNISPAQSYDDLELPPDDEEFKQLVRSRCGLFITFVRNSVHLFHQTAREHLLARTQASSGNASKHPSSLLPQPTYPPTMSERSSWKSSITFADANLVCAEVCLDILGFTVLQEVSLEAFDSLEAGNHCDEELEAFASMRPFFIYAALNWHEHVTTAGENASKILGNDRHSTILDISKPQFWVWFLTVAEYICSSTRRSQLPISNVWTTEKLGKGDREYGLFLREMCIKRLYPMDNKVRALLDSEPTFTPWAFSQVDEIAWNAAHGFRLIDRFHLAYGEYRHTSFSKAVHAIETGDTERASLLLADIPLHNLIWTSITVGATRALKEALTSSKDLSWLRDVPEHIMHRREKWDGWSSRNGKDLRESRRLGWTRPYPPSFVVMLRASTLPLNHMLFEVLADWIERQTLTRDFAQQVWEAGGFIVPSLSRRLVLYGASIDCELWQSCRTALQVAATFWVHEAVQTLIELGADSTKCTANGYNALHWFFYHEELYLGDELVHIEPMVFRELYRKSRIELSIRAILNSVPDKYHLLNQPCGKGWTPLMHAVQSFRSSSTAVKALLEQGPEVDQRDNQRQTALMHFFCAEGFTSRPISIMRHLLLAGANSKTSDEAGNTVLSHWGHRITSAELSYFYAGFNAYNKTFHALANVGPLSQPGLLSKELSSLKIPLVVAARLGNAQMCSALLATGANPNEHGMDADSPLTRNSGSESSDLEDLEWNPLMVALSSRAYATAALLLESGANILFKTRRRKRTKYNKYRMKKGESTPLHLAVAVGSRFWYDVEIYLNTGGLSKGCSFRAATRTDYPISKTSRWEDLQKFEGKRRDTRDEDEESSDPEYEERRNTSVNESRGANLVPYDTVIYAERAQKTPREPLLSTLFDRNATSTQRQDALVEFMLSKGASSNACTVENVTPLVLCVKDGLLNITGILLKYGADPNMAAAGGYTPLMIAARVGYHAIAERLLVSGANPNAQLRVQGPNECKCAAFIEWGNWTFGHCDAPLTALAFAAERGHQSVVELLLKHGADPNLKITHHAHGRLPSTRDMRHQHGSSSRTSDDESEPEPEQWKGFISVGTALTWARGAVRDLLLRHGAEPAVEEAIRECDCTTIRRRKERGPLAGSDDEYPTSEASSDSDGKDPSRDNREISSDSNDKITHPPN